MFTTSLSPTFPANREQGRCGIPLPANVRTPESRRGAAAPQKNNPASFRLWSNWSKRRGLGGEVGGAGAACESTSVLSGSGFKLGHAHTYYYPHPLPRSLAFPTTKRFVSLPLPSSTPSTRGRQADCSWREGGLLHSHEPESDTFLCPPRSAVFLSSCVNMVLESQHYSG